MNRFEEDGGDDVVSSSSSLLLFIQSSVAPSEQEEVRRSIGESLITEVEGLQMELNALLEIWRDYREETQRKELEHQQQQRQTSLRKKLLPEPPNVRERLQQEIKFFAACLKKQSVPVKENTVVKYVLSKAGDEEAHRQRSQSAKSRPQTAKSRSGVEAPVRTQSAGETRANTINSNRNNQSKTNILNSNGSNEHIANTLSQVDINAMDKMRERLKELMKQEIASLHDDILFMQECISGEHDYRMDVLAETTLPSSLPSISDLRRARAALETTFMQSTQTTQVFQAMDGTEEGSSCDNSSNTLQNKPPLAQLKHGSQHHRHNMHGVVDPRHSNVHLNTHAKVKLKKSLPPVRVKSGEKRKDKHRLRIQHNPHHQQQPPTTSSSFPSYSSVPPNTQLLSSTTTTPQASTLNHERLPIKQLPQPPSRHQLNGGSGRGYRGKRFVGSKGRKHSSTQGEGDIIKVPRSLPRPPPTASK
eukprot:m.199034 g.199034  ORF g.199034 m.199034 type:complete len:474 (+) comp13693_c1_seq3:43-1464(+)